MSAIDGLLELLARFEPKSTLNQGKPAKRKKGAKRGRTAERGQIAHKHTIRYELQGCTGTYHALPFTGRLSPGRCGATQFQTRSMRLDVETTSDLAAAFGYASLNAKSDANPLPDWMPGLLAWLMRACDVDLGRSRDGRWSIGYEAGGQQAPLLAENTITTKPKQRLHRLPQLQTTLPPLHPPLLWNLAADLLAESKFHGWGLQVEEAERIVIAASCALVEATGCRVCESTGIKRPTAPDAEPERCPFCAGVGWTAFDRRQVASFLGTSQRKHASRTERPYRRMLSMLINAIQDVAERTSKARGRWE